MINSTLKGGWGHLISPSRSKQVQKWLREQQNTQKGLTWKQFTKTPTTLDVHPMLFGGCGVGLGRTHTQLKYTITISTNNYSEESTTKKPIIIRNPPQSCHTGQQHKLVWLQVHTNLVHVHKHLHEGTMLVQSKWHHLLYQPICRCNYANHPSCLIF